VLDSEPEREQEAGLSDARLFEPAQPPPLWRGAVAVATEIVARLETKRYGFEEITIVTVRLVIIIRFRRTKP
jgi:hypothetical protein